MIECARALGWLFGPGQRGKRRAAENNSVWERAEKAAGREGIHCAPSSAFVDIRGLEGLIVEEYGAIRANQGGRKFLWDKDRVPPNNETAMVPSRLRNPLARHGPCAALLVLPRLLR